MIGLLHEDYVGHCPQPGVYLMYTVFWKRSVSIMRCKGERDPAQLSLLERLSVITGLFQ
jgi:hypothetical protein